MQRNIIIVLLVLFLLCLQWETISGLKRGQQCRDQMTETGGYLSSGPRRPCCQECNLCEKTTKKDKKEDRWHDEDVTACAGQHETIYWYILPYTLTALQGWPDLDQIHQNQRVPMYRKYQTTEPFMDAENPTHVQYTLDALKIDIHQINHNMEALKNDQDTKHHTLMKELKAQIHIDLEQINLKDNMSHRAVGNKVPHTHKELHRTCVTHADLRSCWIIVVAIQGACLCCVLAILSIYNYKVRKGHPDDSSQASMDNAKGMTMICSGMSTHNTPKPGILTAIGGPEEDETHVKDASGRESKDTFVKGTALLFQQAVQAVDFANYGVQFGLSDHEIHHIVNTQAVTLQEEAAKKYEAWNRDGKRGEESNLRDDIVAERIQQLPRVLSQYKRE